MASTTQHASTNDIKCPVALIKSNLILIPTPVAMSSPSYRAFYTSLHANTSFCEMGFGEHFPARSWTDEETYEIISTRDVNHDWRNRGVGDFAVGLLEPQDHKRILGDNAVTRNISVPGLAEDEQIRVLDTGRESLALEEIEWVGYAGVRQARNVDHISSWKDKAEIRYGVSPNHWGKRIANRSAEVVMDWAAAERGVTKFIAETQRTNTRSGRVLEKLGFVQLEESKYWKEPSEVEWERII
ncbi:N-acetyltransferase domain-containing protein [Fusarium falciforme]|uniref:N-acetyltransferase domain-containing protein n=1 Tax=Fusarium falciforme TaxID=195108 RepID=UPI002300E25F|nr:N-acetyltransferase domain-containing protein [Fusarium falciforme]WAO85436.1 N-acetyltransferase domain-containing protein [Fusarium falciforme]